MKRTLEQQELDIYEEYKNVSKVTGTTTLSDFARSIKDGNVGKIIAISEALQLKKIVHLTDDIRNRGSRVILIAGPSSSGKTTFSVRLSLQILAYGKVPHNISLDDYFVDREKTPRDENGEYDYETIHALDIDLLNQQLKQLFNGETVELPRYDFPTGRCIRNTGRFLKLEDGDMLVIEGIHALNPELTSQISDELKYKIFVAPMTGIQTGEKDGRHTYTPPTDNRLLRRIIRDMKYRAMNAQGTLHRWPSVRAGEEKWIYPFYDQADRIFNTSLYYELAVIKTQVEPELERVPADCPEYAEAQRLLAFIREIPEMPSDLVPSTSLLREFLGGSVFNC